LTFWVGHSMCMLYVCCTLLLTFWSQRMKREWPETTRRWEEGEVRQSEEIRTLGNPKEGNQQDMDMATAPLPDEFIAQLQGVQFNNQFCPT
jgi:hypothetical protein